MPKKKPETFAFNEVVRLLPGGFSFREAENFWRIRFPDLPICPYNIHTLQSCVRENRGGRKWVPIIIPPLSFEEIERMGHPIDVTAVRGAPRISVKPQLRFALVDFTLDKIDTYWYKQDFKIGSVRASERAVAIGLLQNPHLLGDQQYHWGSMEMSGNHRIYVGRSAGTVVLGSADANQGSPSRGACRQLA